MMRESVRPRGDGGDDGTERNRPKLGRTHRLLPRIAHPNRELASFVDGMKVFHVARFVVTVLPQAIVKWLQSYNEDRGKFAEFVERYDTVVSEARLVSTVASTVDGHLAP